MRLIVRRIRPLAILFWASLIIPAVVAAGAAVLSHRSVLEIAGLRVAQSATVLREHALRVFEAQEVAMRWVDQRIRGMAWTDIEAAPEVRDLLDEIVRASPHIDAAWLVRPDGRPVVGTDVVPVPAASIADRDDFRVLRQRDVLHLGGNLKAPTAGAITSNLSRRRSAPDGSFDGIIVIDGALSYFVEVWERAALAARHSLALVFRLGIAKCIGFRGWHPLCKQHGLPILERLHHPFHKRLRPPLALRNGVSLRLAIALPIKLR
jgi:hypothetical protein